MSFKYSKVLKVAMLENEDVTICFNTTRFKRWAKKQGLELIKVKDVVELFTEKLYMIPKEIYTMTEV